MPFTASEMCALFAPGKKATTHPNSTEFLEAETANARIYYLVKVYRSAS